MDPNTNLVWIDLEMTGLDPETCVIVEIATIVTDADLAVLEEGPPLVIHQPETELVRMNEVVRQMHTRSGLIDRIRSSTLPLADAEAQTVAFVKRHCREGRSPLCGNSIWQDRRFVERYMPTLAAYLHYRVVDVSTIKELVRRWYPPSYAPPKKAEAHRALDDIRESIEELRWYREHVFTTPERAQ